MDVTRDVRGVRSCWLGEYGHFRFPHALKKSWEKESETVWKDK